MPTHNLWTTCGVTSTTSWNYTTTFSEPVYYFRNGGGVSIFNPNPPKKPQEPEITISKEEYMQIVDGGDEV